MDTQPTQPKVRDEIWNLLFATLPADPEIMKGVSDVFKLILNSVKPEEAAAVRAAVIDLEDLHSRELNTAIERAFALGWELARDATPLVFES